MRGKSDFQTERQSDFQTERIQTGKKSDFQNGRAITLSKWEEGRNFRLKRNACSILGGQHTTTEKSPLLGLVAKIAALCCGVVFCYTKAVSNICERESTCVCACAGVVCVGVC